MVHNRLACLNSNDWALIGSKLHRRVYKLGEEIIREGSLGERICIIRSGEAVVELAGTGKHAVLATLGPDDVCGDMAFLEKGKATASVIAKDLEVEVDEILASDLRILFEAFPRLAYRFYMSLAIVLTQRLRETSRALAQQMFIAERHS